MDKATFTSLLKRRAKDLGFGDCGAAQAESLSPESDHFDRWLAMGSQAGMSYMERNVEKRIDPRLLMEGARSVFVLLMNYKPAEVQPDHLPQIAYYAYGNDYHDVIRPRLKTLAQTITAHFPNSRVRGFVDTAPLFERAWAVRAGLGWIGKNTMLISPVFGSFTFLSVLLTDVEMDYDSPVKPRCGTCVRCVNACPTGALKPNSLDARKCISYDTIESKEDPAYISQYVFGCDLCQKSCPWNKKPCAHTNKEFEPLSELLTYTADDWLALDEEEFNVTFAHSPLQRAGLKRLKEIIRRNREFTVKGNQLTN